MPFYFYYAQTPELRSLSTTVERDSVHAQAWRELRRRRPILWVRSYLLVALCSFVVGLAAGTLLSPFVGVATFDTPWGPFTIAPGRPVVVLGAALGSGVGTLLHIHAMASALRPVYSEVLMRRGRGDS